MARSLMEIEAARAIVGYGLNGLFSLEEGHAQDLAAYYQSLATHPHHNYYEGREDAELTSWLAYFLETLATIFTSAKGLIP